MQVPIEAYHASPVLFDAFRIGEGGLHVGGLCSAVQAVERHLLGSGSDEFYLYKVLITAPVIISCQDRGDAIGWEDEAEFTGASVLKYINRFEADSACSYAIFDVRCVQILEVQKKNLNEFENILNELFN